MTSAIVLISAERSATPTLGEALAAVGQVPGVVRTHTRVAFTAYSRHDLESVFALGSDSA